MKTFCLVVVLCLVLDSNKSLAFAPAPAVSVTNAETGEITYRYPSLETPGYLPVSTHRLAQKSSEQKFFGFWFKIDNLDPARHFRIVVLPLLIFFLYNKSEERRERQRCILK